MRPIRPSVSDNSLKLMGVPHRFLRHTLKDYDTFGKKSLADVKSFMQDYLDQLDENMSDGRGVCFIGANGVGKSMLSCIVLKEAYRHRYTCRRVTFSAYIGAYTASWGNSHVDKDSAEQELFEKYKGVEFLVLEEIGKEIDSKIAKPILEDLLRYREEQGYVTFICTNLTPDTLRELYGPSVCSLINGNTTIIVIDGDDRRMEVFNHEL